MPSEEFMRRSVSAENTGPILPEKLADAKRAVHAYGNTLGTDPEHLKDQELDDTIVRLEESAHTRKEEIETLRKRISFSEQRLEQELREAMERKDTLDPHVREALEELTADMDLQFKGKDFETPVASALLRLLSGKKDLDSGFKALFAEDIVENLEKLRRLIQLDRGRTEEIDEYYEAQDRREENG